MPILHTLTIILTINGFQNTAAIFFIPFSMSNSDESLIALKIIP